MPASSPRTSSTPRIPPWLDLPRRAVAPSAVIAALLLAGCSSPDESTDAGAEAASQTLPEPLVLAPAPPQAWTNRCDTGIAAGIGAPPAAGSNLACPFSEALPVLAGVAGAVVEGRYDAVDPTMTEVRLHIVSDECGFADAADVDPCWLAEAKGTGPLRLELGPAFFAEHAADSTLAARLSFVGVTPQNHAEVALALFQAAPPVGYTQFT